MTGDCRGLLECSGTIVIGKDRRTKRMSLATAKVVADQRGTLIFLWDAVYKDGTHKHIHTCLNITQFAAVLSLC
jgi:hypothetical protein